MVLEGSRRTLQQYNKGSNVIYCIDRCMDRGDHITSVFAGAGVWLYVVYLLACVCVFMQTI